jgi:hypothetical protein
MVTAPPATGARKIAASALTMIAIALPAMTAAMRIGGAERRSMAWRVIAGKENRSARPTRIGGFAKGARTENENATRWRRRSYFFFFEDFFAAFFFAGIGITSFWPRVVRYIDTLTS